MRLFRLSVFLILAIPLTGCFGSLRRDDIAARAKTKMIGMSKETVLGCMGPPKKKATEGGTEVWSYFSTDGRTDRRTDKFTVASWYQTHPSSTEKSFCTVNVVMKDGAVTSVHYLGPKGTHFYNDKDQCGYAVEACADTE